MGLPSQSPYAGPNKLSAPPAAAICINLAVLILWHRRVAIQDGASIANKCTERVRMLLYFVSACKFDVHFLPHLNVAIRSAARPRVPLKVIVLLTAVPPDWSITFLALYWLHAEAVIAREV